MKVQVVEREVPRGIYIGSFGGPTFGEKGRRLQAGMGGRRGRLYNNRKTRALWKVQSSTVLPVPNEVPSPSPERVEENIGEGTRGHGRSQGVPCETQTSYHCCKRKAFALGPKKARLCVQCLKAAWTRQGYCPLRIVVLQ